MSSPLDSLDSYEEITFESVLVPDASSYLPGDSIMVLQEESILNNLNRMLLLLAELSYARENETGVDDGVHALVFHVIRALEQAGYDLPVHEPMREVPPPLSYYDGWLLHRLRDG